MGYIRTMKNAKKLKKQKQESLLLLRGYYKVKIKFMISELNFSPWKFFQGITKVIAIQIIRFLPTKGMYVNIIEKSVYLATSTRGDHSLDLSSSS